MIEQMAIIHTLLNISMIVDEKLANWLKYKWFNIIMSFRHHLNNRKVPKFSDARKLCCNLPKIQIKRPKLRVSYQNDANGIAKSEDSDQTAPLEAV